MNITLRKANALQNAILDAIRAIKIKTAIEVNEFQDVGAELASAVEELYQNDKRRSDLYIAYYNIRALVGTANVNGDVNLKLSQCAYYDKRIAQLQELVDSAEVTDLDIINGKLEKIRTRPADARSSFYASDAVTTGVLTRAQIDQFKETLRKCKKEKQKLNDEILEANIKNEIPLSDDVVAVLTAEGIL